MPTDGIAAEGLQAEGAALTGIRARRETFDPALTCREEMMVLRVVDLGFGYGIAALVAAIMIASGRPEVEAAAVATIGGTAATLLVRGATMALAALRTRR